MRLAQICLIIKFSPCIWKGKWLKVPYKKKNFYKMFSKAKHFQDVIGTCMSKFIRFIGLFWGLDMLLMQSPRNLGKALFKSWKSLCKFLHTKNSKCLIQKTLKCPLNRELIGRVDLGCLQCLSWSFYLGEVSTCFIVLKKKVLYFKLYFFQDHLCTTLSVMCGIMWQLHSKCPFLKP